MSFCSLFRRRSNRGKFSRSWRRSVETSLRLEPMEERHLLAVTPMMVADVEVGAGSSSASQFVEVGTTTFFVADDAIRGMELWKTDGTKSGTVLVKDIYPGGHSSSPNHLTNVDGVLYFTADDGEHGVELWKSDGTAAGTVLVKDLDTGTTHDWWLGDLPNSSDPQNLTVVGGTLFFTASDGENGVELWKSDGTAAGTVLVKDIRPGSTYDPSTDDDVPNSSEPANLTNVNGTLFFTADDGEHGVELWMSDGTASGTRIVKDINPGADSSTPSNLIHVGDTLYFTADDGTHGVELWMSDGTAAGTVLVKDIRDGSADSNPGHLTSAGDFLYFTADDGTHGVELWMSDGTASGTHMVQDINPGADSSSPSNLTHVGGTLYFAADDGTHGVELWRTNGTASGTLMVKDVNPGANSSSPSNLTHVGGILFFTADDGTHGVELWRTNGTASGTYLVGDIRAGGAGSNPSYLTGAAGTLMFAADDGHYGSEVYRLIDTDIVEEAVATLKIIIDGTPVDIPGDVGVDADGKNLATIYTTDDQGTLQISRVDGKPITQHVTLGDFFDTWRTNAGVAGNNADAVFHDGQILGYAAGGDYRIQMFVNGQADRRFDEYVVQDGDEIVIVYTANEVVSLNTNLGSILIELYEDDTPITVANFLSYVNDGDYVNSFFHRFVPGFVIQGGGYTTSHTYFYYPSQFSEVPTDDPIQNEPGISNTIGTVAMAKLGGDPNSATSQFFINLGDNSGNLDTQNGGFTVFGRVLDATIIEAIAALEVNDTNESPFDEVPVTDDGYLVVFSSLGGEGTLSGTSFEDADYDGVRDSGEPGLGGLTVFADENDNGLLDPGEHSTTTDANGDWQLRLPAGAYVIRQIAGGDLYPTTPDGTSGHTVTVEIGRATSGLDFANIDNAPPVAMPDSYTVDEDGSLVVGAGEGVLANDSDAEDDTLTAVLVDGPEHGTLSLASDGSFTYTPDDDFYGTDSFTYRADDGNSQSGAATVTITVQAVADPPTAVDDQYTVAAGAGARQLDVLANDTTEPDGSQTMTITAVTQGSKGGTVAVTSGGAKVTYTPASGFTGTETFTYTITDSDGLTDTATVTVLVTDDAAGQGTSSVSGYVYCDTDKDGVRDEGEVGIRGSVVTLSGTDDDGNPVSIARLTDENGYYIFENLAPGTYQVTQTQPEAFRDGQDAIGSLGGTVENDRLSEIVLGDDEHSTENNFGELGLKCQYVSLAMFLASTPSAKEYLPDLVARAEEAAGNTTIAQLIREGAIAFPGANRAPVAVDDAYSVDQNKTLTVSATEGVLKNDFDPDDDELTAAVVTQPSHGTLSFHSNGSFTYDPDDDFTGTDTFKYRVSDGSLTATATVTITVGDVNVAPQAVNDSYTVSSGATLTIGENDGVLANDTDQDDDELTAVLVSSVAHGTLSLNGNGSFTYTPSAGFHGEDSFTYRAYDGIAYSNTATVTITVTAVNVAPVALDDSYTVSPGATLAVGQTEGVLANDTDQDGDSLTAVLVSSVAHGTLSLNSNGSFTYTPSAGFHGEDSFTYRAYDGTAHSGTATVTIIVNDAPVAADDAYEVDEDGTLTVATDDGVLANDDDPDGDEMTAILVGGPAHGTLVLDDEGSFVYTPNADFYGTDSFTYRASDGYATSEVATVTITVAPVPDAPVAVDDSYTVVEGLTLVVDANEGVLSNDHDPDGDDLTASLVHGPTYGTLTFSDDGSFTYVPDEGFVGTDTFTYTAGDGTFESEVATVTIVVASATGPTAVDDAYDVDRDATLTVGVDQGVMANDLNLDDDTIAVVGAEPIHGTLELAADGSFVYTPDDGFTGVDTFTYVLTDGTTESNAATVTITVGVLAAIDDAYEVDVNEYIVVLVGDGVLANDVGIGDGAIAEMVSDVTHGTLELNADGSFVYTPGEDFTGVDRFTYKVVDGDRESNVATVTITVTAEVSNDAPVAVDDEYHVDEDGVLAVGADEGVRANDFDVDGSPATPLSSLVITEINYNPYEPDELNDDEAGYDKDDFEFIELQNVGDATIDLSGVRFIEGISFDFTGSGVTELAPGETVLVVSNWAAFQARYGDDLNVAGEYGGGDQGRLANFGERIVLVDASDNTILDFTYDDANGWPTEADGKGSTLEVVDVTGDYSDPANWIASAQRGGTPGTGTSQTVDVPDVLTITVVDPPQHGTLEMNQDGSFVYTPDADFHGTDSFTYRLNDGELDSRIATVRIHVHAVNDAPDGEDDAYTVDEDGVLEVDAGEGVLANDSDVDGSPASPLASLVITEINYHPHGPTDDELAVNADFVGDDFEFIELQNVGDATIDLTGVRFTEGISFDFTGGSVIELAPGETVVVVADLEAFEARYGTGLNVAGEFGSSSLSNEGDTIALVDAAGSVIHQFAYGPADGWPAEADGGGSTLEVVDVTGDYNDPANWAASTEQGGTPGTGISQTVLRDVLVAILVDGPEHGDLVFHDDGSFTYTPDVGFSGTDTFTYRAGDGAAQSDLVTVTIHVEYQNQAPEAHDDQYEVDQNGALVVGADDGVLANDSDPDGSPATPLFSLVVTEINYHPYAPTADELEQDANLDEDDFEFIELQNVSGQTIRLDGVRITRGVTFDFTTGEILHLAPGETVLVVANRSAFEIRYGTGLNVAGEFGGGLSNAGETIAVVDDADRVIQEFAYGDSGDWPAEADGGGATLEIVDVTGDYNDPANWVASTEQGGTPGTGTSQSIDVSSVRIAVLVSGPAHGELTLNNDGSFTYEPDEGFSGTDSFTYRASDGDAESDVATVTIHVQPVNEAPEAVADSYGTTQNTPLVVDADSGVLANDVDPDGSPATPISSLVITEINYQPYAPTGDELAVDDTFGADDFEFIELQNIGNATIDLSGVRFTEGISFDFTSSDVTELAPGATVLVVSNLTAFEARYGTVVNLAGEFAGDLSDHGETIELADAHDRVIRRFTYDNENGWPAGAAGEGYTLEVLDVSGDYDDPANWTSSDELGGTPGTGTDATAAVDFLMALLVDGPEHGDLIFNADGSFLYTPGDDFVGTDHFTYKASDGADDSEEVTVTIEVNAP